MSPRGGKREGSGRPPGRDDTKRNTPRSIRVTKEVSAYLAKVGTGVIEDLIRESEQFRDWQEVRAKRREAARKAAKTRRLKKKDGSK